MTYHADKLATPSNDGLTRRQALQAAGAAALVALAAGRSQGAAPENGTEAPRGGSGNHNDPNLHLFVDDEDLETVEGLARVLNRPARQPAPVLSADRPW